MLFNHCAALVLLGCSANIQSPPAETAPLEPKSSGEAESAIPLTVDERALMESMNRHVAHLSGKIGERNVDKSWELAEAADYIAGELEKMGFPLERQGYEAGDVAAQNIAVTVAGGARGDEILVVAAHYDSPSGYRGINSGATGTAALLEIARLMRDARLTRTLRLVFLSLGESPHGDHESRGARHYAKKLAEEAQPERFSDSDVPPHLPRRQVKPLGFVHLDRLGSFRKRSDRAGTVVHLLLTPGAELLRSSIAAALTGEPVRIEQSSFRPFVNSGKDSDVAAFYEQGVSGLSVSGDGALVDDISELQQEEMARVVMRLRGGIGQIVGEKLTNDGMLTPGAP